MCFWVIAQKMWKTDFFTFSRAAGDENLEEKTASKSDLAFLRYYMLKFEVYL